MKKLKKFFKNVFTQNILIKLLAVGLALFAVIFANI